MLEWIWREEIEEGNAKNLPVFEAVDLLVMNVYHTFPERKGEAAWGHRLKRRKERRQLSCLFFTNIQLVGGNLVMAHAETKRERKFLLHSNGRSQETKRTRQADAMGVSFGRVGRLSFRCTYTCTFTQALLSTCTYRTSTAFTRLSPLVFALLG